MLLKQFYKLETFSLYKFVFCYCSNVLQSFAQGFFLMVLALPRLLVLSKIHQQLISNNLMVLHQNGILIFLSF